MHLTCPKCRSSRPTLKHKRCPSCRRRLTLANKVAGSVASIAKWVTGGPLIQCPSCEFPLLVGRPNCPKCELSLTASRALQHVAGPAKALISRNRKGDGQRAKRIGHFICLLLSLAFFRYGLQQVVELDTMGWVKHAGVCVLFVGAIGITIRFVVPRHVLHILLLRTSWVIKLTLVLTYMSVFLLVWASLGVWWTKAVALATISVVTWGGIWVFVSLMWPATLQATNILLQPEVEPFDYTRRQGRSGWSDRG